MLSAVVLSVMVLSAAALSVAVLSAVALSVAVLSMGHLMRPPEMRREASANRGLGP